MRHEYLLLAILGVLLTASAWIAGVQNDEREACEAVGGVYLSRDWVCIDVQRIEPAKDDPKKRKGQSRV